MATKCRKVVTVSSRCSQNQCTGMASGVGTKETGSMEVPLSVVFIQGKIFVLFQKMCPVTIPEEFLEQFYRRQSYIKRISLLFYTKEVFVKLFEKKKRKLVADL
jgi:hypothetical protein